MYGGTLAAIEGKDIGRAALNYAIFNAAGSALYTTAGVVMGSIASRGEAPEVKDGALLYRDRAGFLRSFDEGNVALTLGHVIIAPPKAVDLYVTGIDSGAMDLDVERGLVDSLFKHEFTHVGQFDVQGAAFLPGYFIQFPVGFGKDSSLWRNNSDETEACGAQYYDIRQ